MSDSSDAALGRIAIVAISLACGATADELDVVMGLLRAKPVPLLPTDMVRQVKDAIEVARKT